VDCKTGRVFILKAAASTKCFLCRSPAARLKGTEHVPVASDEVCTMSADSPTPFGADRNLLFGIMALQMDFISRDALIAAMNAWVLDKGRTLGEILEEQGALRKEDRDLLEVLIKRHLQRHGNDVQKSLASLNSVGSLHDDLQNVADPDVHASLAFVQGQDRPREDPYV